MGVQTEQGHDVRHRLYIYLVEQQLEHGYLPTITEMGRAFNMRPTGIKWHLEKLEEQGKVSFDPAKMSRSLRVVTRNG